jgi:signal transduction histidine kinase
MPGMLAVIQALISTPERLLWAVRVRWLVIGGFLCLALAAHGLGLFASVVPCVHAAALGAALNGVNHWCVRHQRHVSAVTALAIPLDAVLITYVVLNTGGTQSPFVLMYVVQVLATASLVDTAIAALSTLLAIVLWSLAIGLQANGHIGGAALFAPTLPAGSIAATRVYNGTWAVFLLYCLALLVYLGGYVSNRLRESERDLRAKNIELQAALAALRGAHDELRAAHERLKLTESHLVQSEKMRSLGELVAGVAHELSNPISFVSGNVEHLRIYVERLHRALEACASAELPAAERARLEQVRQELRVDEALADLPSLLDDCEEGARRTKRIVNELRTFSRSDERGGWQQTDLHRGVDSTVALLTHRLKDHIAIHRQFGELPQVECLPGQLNQVLMNILANAVDAIGGRPGNIWISTRLDNSQTGDVEPAVIITIRDDGCGMSPDLRTKVFDPFFTTKAVGQGTGLGLSVSYGIIARHRGTLSASSTLGAGSTFTITLPVRQTLPAAAPPA